jgi:AcrR family transcriptional regulator
VKAAEARHVRILDEGLALISREGLQGITLGILAERAEMSKSGLFAHFRSKEEVQLQLLEHTRAFGARHILAHVMEAEEGLPRLRTLVRNWFGWAGRSGLPGGCPLAAALFELDDLEGPVREKVVEMDRGWREFLGSVVAQAVTHGHFRSGLDTDQFVWELCGIYLGHHASERFLRDPEATRRAETAFEALIARARS